MALPFLAAIAGIMAVVFRFTSRGPILFKQERVGFMGSRFMVYKFRTMVVGANVNSHQAYCENLLGSQAPMIKLDAKGDTRVIPGAWILRATGLDELPQIINVYRREMSIVGPRPCMKYEYDKYSALQRERFNAVPGLTGLWQVSGKNRTTFEEMVALDIRYSENSSFWLDLKIILMTVPALVMQVSDTRRARNSSLKPARSSAPVRSYAALRSPKSVPSQPVNVT